MKNIVLALLSCVLFSSCSIYSHYSVSELKKKYDNKMDNNRVDKFTDLASGKSYEIKRKELFQKTPIYFSSSEISRPFSVISLSTWDYINLRVIAFPLVLFSKSHIKNQSLHKGSLINASLRGDGVIVSANPFQYSIIKFTDGKESVSLSTSEVLDKSDIKKAQKELENKLKAEKKKFKKGDK